MIKSLLVAIALSIGMVGTSIAEQVTVTTTKELSKDQIAKLNLEAAKMAAEPTTVLPELATVDEARQWIDLGTAIGKGRGSAAKEVGIAVNEFAQTPVGMFTMVLIAYNYLGDDVLGVALGLLWFAFTVPLWLWAWRRHAYKVTVVTYEKGKGPDGKTRVKTIEPMVYKDIRGDENITWRGSVMVILLGLIIVIGTVSIA